MSTASQLQQLYVAYFGRAADPAGLDYWVAKGTTTKEFAAHMHAQTEFQAVNGSLSTESQVNQIYQNLFNRDADAAGLLYWTTQIESGVLELASIANDLIWNVENDHGGATDKLTLAAKQATAVAYTAEIRKSADAILAYQADSTDPWKAGEDFTTAVNFINSATSTNTPTAAEVTASVAKVAETDTSINGTTYVLTSAAATTDGTAFNDLFYAVTVGELTASDVVNGGAGADTLRFAIDEDDTAFRPITTGVEHLRFTVVDNDTNDVQDTPGLNLDLATGVETVQLDNYTNDGGTDTTTIAGIGTGVVVKLADNAGAADRDNHLTITYDAVTGTADAATIKVDTTTADNTYGTITAAGIETLTLINSGDKVATYATTAADATTLNIQGTGSINTVTAVLATSVVADVTADTTITATAGTAGDLGAALTYDITVGSGATYTQALDPDDYDNLAAAARTLSATVKGAGKASLSTTSLDWGDQTTYKDTFTIDASANTGGVTGDFSGWANDNATNVNFTGGTAADTVEVKAGDMDSTYTIDGGAGTDILQVDLALTGNHSNIFYTDTLTGSDLPSISNMEVNKLIFSGANGARTVTATSATLDTLELAGTIGAQVLTVDSIKSGQTVNLTANSEHASSAYVLTVKDATTASPASSLTVTSSLTGTAAAATGEIDDLRADTVTTLNLDLAGSGTAVTATLMDNLSADKASLVKITGEEELTITTNIDAADDATLDFSAHTGTVTATIDATNDYTVKGSSTAANTLSMAAGLDADDIIIGGSSTSDSLTATITGLTTTTGKLNVSNVETLQFLTATTAATIDATSITGADILKVTGTGDGNGGDASVATTFTNLAAGTKIGLGSGTAGDAAADSYRSSVAIGLADSSGSSDSVTVNLGARNHDDDISATLTGTGIETLNIVDATAAKNSNLTISGFDASSVVLTGGLAGEITTLNTLSSSTTSVDASAFENTVVVSAATNTATTFSAKVAGSFTGGAGNDTFTLGSTAGYIGSTAVGTIAGGTGTDTLTIYGAASGDWELVTGVETINLILEAADSFTTNVVTSHADDGLNAATTVNITGGKAGQVYNNGGHVLKDIGAKTLDSTGLTGSFNYIFDDEGLTVTNVSDMITIKGGSGTADVVTASYSTGTSGDFTMSGIETLVLGADTGANTVSLLNVTGLEKIEVTDDGGTQHNLTITNVLNNEDIQIGNASADYEGANAKLVTTLKTNTTADVLNLNVYHSDNLDIDTNNIETLNITYNDGGTGGSDEATDLIITATGVTAGTVNFTGTDTSDVLTLSGLASGYTTVDASALQGGITLGAAARINTAITVTGSTVGNDSIAFEHANDVLDGGGTTAAPGSDTLVVTHSSSNSGMVIDLRETADQITSFNGSSNAAVQKGFENVNLSGITSSGSVGSTVYGNTADNTITGTGYADTITGDAGADTLKGAAGGDTITGGEGADRIEAGAGADTIDLTETTAAVDKILIHDATAANNVTITGFGSEDILIINLSDTTIAAAGTTIINAAETALAEADYNEDDNGGSFITEHVNVFTASDTTINAMIQGISTEAAGDGEDTITIFYNATSGNTEMYHSGDADTHTSYALMASFTDIGVSDIAATFSEANFMFF